MFRRSLAVMAWTVFAIPAFAQVAPYNPYAQDVQDFIPITPDGKINWPTFYKSIGMKNKFQYLFDIGACRGTGKGIVEGLEANKVDINKLDEKTIVGKAMRVQNGSVIIVDASNQVAMAVTHPAGVSNVSVQGKMAVTDLRPGLIVRFEGRVDELGRSTEPADSLEVFTPAADFQPDGVESGRVQTIVGQVVSLRSGILKLQTNVGKLRRLTISVAEDCVVNVNTCELSLIAPGDDVTVTGHVYGGDGINTEMSIFANKVEVAKVYEQPLAVSKVSNDK